MALLETSPVFLDTEARLTLVDFGQQEPTEEELAAIEAEMVTEIEVDSFELMKSYVKGLRGESFAARDVQRFEPEFDAVERKLFMQKFIKGLLRDEELAPVLRIDGRTKGRTYWLASVFSPEAALEGPSWFEENAHIELNNLTVNNAVEARSLQHLLRQLHDMQEDGIEEINGISLSAVFAVANQAISDFMRKTAHKRTESERSVRIQGLTRSRSPSRDSEVDDYDFFQDANCLGVDPDLFFPERGASTREAKEVCRGCVVQGDCLEYALATGQKFGIWGGRSERERRRLRRQRKIDTITDSKQPQNA